MRNGSRGSLALAATGGTGIGLVWRTVFSGIAHLSLRAIFARTSDLRLRPRVHSGVPGEFLRRFGAIRECGLSLLVIPARVPDRAVILMVERDAAIVPTGED
jgi:hypothetical protein